MNPLTITELRSNLSTYLDRVKTKNKPIVFWERSKKEFLITPYPDLENDFDLIDCTNVIEDEIIKQDYYKWLQNSMKDWFLDENDDLFE